MSGILINTVTIESSSAPLVLKSGTLVTDSNLITAAQGMGGVFGPATDASLLAAQAIATKMRSKRAADENAVDKIMMAAYMQSLQLAAMQHLLVDIPLATIKAQASGVAFNVGAALPTNAKLQKATVQVLATVTGGSLSAVKFKLQGGADTAGSIIGGATGSDVFTALATFNDGTGSNPYTSRSAQQLQATLVSTGDTLANAATGHLQIDVYYNIETP